MIEPVLLENGQYACGECGALVPEGKTFANGVGTYRDPVKHRAWCPTRRMIDPTIRLTSELIEQPDVRKLSDPPAPGPIWTNGLSELEPHEHDAAVMRRARTLLEHFHKELGQQWAWAAMHYITVNYRSEGLDTVSAALLHLIAEEMHG